MEEDKFKRLFLIINGILLSFVILIIIASLVLHLQRGTVYILGIIDRILLGLWCVFNGLWNTCTEYYSFYKNSGKNLSKKKVSKAVWWIVFAVGIGLLVTAFLGYGFNGVTKPLV